MRKILVIAAREYRAAVRTKSFLISLILMPLMMCSGAIVQMIAKKLDDAGDKRFAIVDRTPGQAIFPALEEAARKRNETDIFDPGTGKQTRPTFTLERVEPSADTPEAMNQQRYDLSQQVHQGRLFGFLEIGADALRYSATLPESAALRPPEKASDRVVLRYQSNNPTYGTFYRWADKVVNGVIHSRRCAEAGLPPGQTMAVLQPVPLLAKGLSKRNAETGAIEDPPTESQVAHILVPAALLGMMFMMIMVGATPLMQGVIEEKMQRIAEVLLGSVRPFALMMGKLLGMVGVSLTILAVYLGGAYWAAQHYGFTEYLPLDLLAWFVLFQVLAVLMYGSLFTAIGAACTDMKETQTMIMPVMLVACLPLFFLVQVIEKPNGAFALGLSLFPPATPMLMIARLAVPPGIPWWQPVLGIAAVLLATTLCVYVAGRIFRVGLLLQGKGARLGDLVKWVFQA